MSTGDSGRNESVIQLLRAELALAELLAKVDSAKNVILCQLGTRVLRILHPTVKS
jgi:hypothetical protein